MARQCICGKPILLVEEEGPVLLLDPMKVYKDATSFGHPLSRQKVYACGTCAPIILECLVQLRGSYEREDLE